MKIKLGISLALAILVFIFVSQNTDVAQVNFLTWSIEMSLVLLVFIMLGAGIVIGWLLNSYLRFARKRSQIDATEAEQAQVTETVEEKVNNTLKEKETNEP
jgi:uncharacterized integral membrane protein